MVREDVGGDDVGYGESAGRRTRSASRSTRGLSGERLTTQLLTTASQVLSPAGRFSISPRRNSTLAQASPRSLAPSRALESMSGVMSTPMTRPEGPRPWRRGSSRCRRRTEVEDGLAGLERGEAHGGAASDAEVGATGDREVLGGVSDGRAVGRARHAAPAGVGRHLGVISGHGGALRIRVRSLGSTAARGRGPPSRREFAPRACTEGHARGRCDLARAPRANLIGASEQRKRAAGHDWLSRDVATPR